MLKCHDNYFELPGEWPKEEDMVPRQRVPGRRNNEMPDPYVTEALPADQITEPFMSVRHSAPTEGFTS